MPDRLQLDYPTTELDPDLLSTPFQQQTNWHIITGTISSGKSSLIKQLADSNFKTVLESARMYIDEELVKGRSIQEIHTDGAALQRGIVDMQLRVEGGLRAADLIFLDRGLPDMLAWYRVRGLDPNEFLEKCFYHQYASIFMLDPLPFEPDEQRVEDFAAVTSYLDEWHTRDYHALGYKVVRVPALVPDERLAFVLGKLSEQGSI